MGERADGSMAVQEVIPTCTRGRDEEGYDGGSCNTAIEVPTQKKRERAQVSQSIKRRIRQTDKSVRVRICCYLYVEKERGSAGPSPSALISYQVFLVLTLFLHFKLCVSHVDLQTNFSV